jgi:hypothetical protein
MELEINRWYKKLWETRGCRFNASKRMEMHDKWSAIAINFVSGYIIILNLFVYLKNRPEILTDELITISTISLSILVMIISVLLSSRDYKLKAHKFHSCGLALSPLYDKVSLWKANIKNVQIVDIEQLIIDYNLIIEKYDLNHDRIDYLLFKSQNISEFAVKYQWLFKCSIWLKFNISTFIKYWVYVFLPPLGLIIFLILKWSETQSTAF